MDNIAKKMSILSISDDTMTKEKDGDDGETYVNHLLIKRVDNGWMVAVIWEDESESISVFRTDGKDEGDKDAVKHILENMGLENTIKIK